jgi:hypothetical protein
VTVLAAPKQGGGPVTLFSSGTDLSGIAAATSGVYVAGVGPRDSVSLSTSSLYRVSVGSPPAQLAPKTACDDIAVDESFAYCRYEQTLTFVPLRGASPPVGVGVGHALAGMAVDHGRVFFTTAGSSDPSSFIPLPDGKLSCMDGPDRAITDLATGLASASSVVIDAGNVYFVARAGIFAIHKP